MGSDSVAHEGERNNTRFERVRLLRRALPISLLILRKKKNDCFAVYFYINHVLFRVRSWKLWEFEMWLDCVARSLERFENATPDQRLLILMKDKAAKIT